MKKQTYLFTFPFTGKVKTQLKITTAKDGSKRLVKPKDVKLFENAVRIVLSTAFPLESRPIEGYLKFEMVHYTTYRRDEENLIVPARHAAADLDNVAKCLIDCFQPIYKNITKLDENGDMVFTKKGNVSYEKQLVSPGVIKNDKYIMKANLLWVPVESKDEERIEVYITPFSEKELFIPPSFSDRSLVRLNSE